MIVKNPRFEISAVSKKQYPNGNLPEIVLVGKSNVGKSSFINTMLNRKALARTSNTPGKTRQINFYNIDNNFFSSLKDGLISGEELTSEILKQELKIAEINRRLNPYYAINELVIYSPEGNEDEEFYQLYEPAVGKKVFKSWEEEEEYKKLNKVL